MDKKKIAANVLGIIGSLFMTVVCAAALLWQLICNHKFEIVWFVLLGVGVCGLWICLDDRKEMKKEKEPESKD